MSAQFGSAATRSHRGRATALLTPLQHRVLARLEEYIAANRFPPTTRELAAGCGIASPSMAYRVVCALERKGYVQRTPGVSRGLAIARPKVDYRELCTADLLAASATAICHAAHRDHVLVMAARVEDSEVKAVLIQDAGRRNELVTEVERELAAVSDHVPDARGMVRPLLHVLGETVDWPEFVVDALLLNRGTAAVSMHASPDHGPPLRVLLAEIADLCDRAARQAEDWLESIVSDAPDAATARRLRSRAAAVMRAMRATSGALDRHMPDRLLSTLQVGFASLPKILVR